MFKLMIITLTIVGVLVYVGFYGYNRLLNVSLASNVQSFTDDIESGIKSSVMTISDCTPGYIPFFPSYNGKIMIHPNNIEIKANAKVKIINGDSTPHTIGVAFTKVWESINPGGALEIDTTQLPPSGKWFITCDGINLGDQSPVIQPPSI